jgi:hypothetical protein
MTNDPASIAAALRTLAVYTVCCVLAIVVGVLMTNPLTYSSLGFVAVLCAIMLIPILLKWHYPLMILCLSTPIYAFFVKGDPQLCLVMTAISLAISIVERALNQRHFINVPEITWPLLCLIGVIAITAKLTGGIGLKAFGSDVYGGKKYVFLVAGILGYFALVAHRIPPEKAQKYLSYFFLGGVLGFVGDFAAIAPKFTHPIFWFLPPESNFDPDSFQVGTTRLVGTGFAGMALTNVLIARYGIRGIFLSGKLWRSVIFFIALCLVFLGGFRSALIMVALTFTLQFFLEGMHRTRLMPFFMIAVLAVMAATVPLASKLPFTFQRTLAFVPESVLHLTADARLAAQGSTDWRVEMWQALLPQIPTYLLLGKGYAIHSEDFAAMGMDTAIHNSADAADQGLAISGDYHSGPLSVILPFGIWGVIAFLWFIYVSMRVVYRNFRYGDPKLRTANTFIFTTYTVAVFTFFFIAGALNSEMQQFTALLGLSVAINQGVCRVPVRSVQNIPFKRKTVKALSKPQPAFQRGTAGTSPV